MKEENPELNILFIAAFLSSRASDANANCKTFMPFSIIKYLKCNTLLMFGERTSANVKALAAKFHLNKSHSTCKHTAHYWLTCTDD